MSPLATLRLRRAALRLDIAATRLVAAQSCADLGARARAAALGLSLVRLGARLLARRRDRACG